MVAGNGHTRHKTPINNMSIDAIAATNKPCHGQLTIHIGALIFKTPHDSDKIILLYVSRLVQGEL